MTRLPSNDETLNGTMTSKRNGVGNRLLVLFDRLGGFSGGVLLDEPLLPASSLTRNTRNTTAGGRAASLGAVGFAALAVLLAVVTQGDAYLFFTA